MNIVPCLTWVKRGVAKRNPDRVQLDKDELKRIIEETKGDIEDIEDDADQFEEEEDSVDDSPDIQGAGAKKTKHKAPDKAKKRKHGPDLDEEESDIIDKYGLDDYDDEDANPLHGIGDLAYYASNDDDPYITQKDDINSDDEDFEIKPTDNLILVGRAEKDACTLETYIYNEDLASLYIHHDLVLPSFPLAMEWLNYDVGDGKSGNFVAIGSMETTIDIWDVDLIDTLEPVATLGSKKKRGKKKSKGTGHTDAVLGLSWNSIVRTALASASADFTLGLWDLSGGKLVTSIKQHQEKVQCVAWHPFEAQSLLSGSFDKTVKIYDCRSPNDSFKTWDLKGEVEGVIWNNFAPLYFLASTDSGHIYCLDSRQDKPIFTLSAHTEAVTGLCLSSQIPGLLVTTSTDKTFKVWDIQDHKPSLILDRDLKMNELHCVSGCAESPFVFAIGGEKEVKVWDIRESAAVRKHFGSRAPAGVDVGLEDDEATEASVAASAMESLSIGPGTTIKLPGTNIDVDDETDKSSKKKKKKKKRK